LVVQGYGLTEIAGGSFITAGREESLHWGSAGRLAGGFEVKIVDPVTGDSLPPGKQGELWIKGPSVMKGKMKKN
jgi:4-coumarate--CoA ligase